MAISPTMQTVIGRDQPRAALPEQDPEGRLGRIGHRGEGIGGQDRQRNQAGEPLGISLRARQGTPQKATGKREHPCGAQLGSP